MARAVAIYLKRGNCSMLPLSNLNDSSKGGIRNSANHLALPMGHYRLHLLFSLEHGTASHAMFHSQSSCFVNSHIMRENWTSTHRRAGPAGLGTLFFLTPHLVFFDPPLFFWPPTLFFWPPTLFFWPPTLSCWPPTLFFFFKIYISLVFHWGFCRVSCRVWFWYSWGFHLGFYVGFKKGFLSGNLVKVFKRSCGFL